MTAYRVKHAPVSEFVQINGLKLHYWRWSAQQPSTQVPLVLLHGWMDVGASFQFMVDVMDDAFLAQRDVIAPDWRGYGLSAWSPTGNYYFTDYLADLDGLLHQLYPNQAVDLLGHSMGGNVVCLYAGIRPEAVRRLVNVEGFGLRASEPAQAPERYRRWLDQLRSPETLKPYGNLSEVAGRLQKNNPRLTADQAEFLALHWAKPEGDQVLLRADPAHKHTNPMLYRLQEVLACWSQIKAPTLWINGAQSNTLQFLGGIPDLAERQTHIQQLKIVDVPDAGHMVQHDQPQVLARLVQEFLA